MNISKSQLKKIARQKRAKKMIQLKRQGIGIGAHGLRGEKIKDCQRNEAALKERALRLRSQGVK